MKRIMIFAMVLLFAGCAELDGPGRPDFRPGDGRHEMSSPPNGPGQGPGPSQSPDHGPSQGPRPDQGPDRGER